MSNGEKENASNTLSTERNRKDEVYSKLTTCSFNAGEPWRCCFCPAK